MAIKKVLQDPRFKNRELDIMKELDHDNVTVLRHYFFSHETKKGQEEVFLNLVLDYVPENLHDFNRSFLKQRGEPMPMIYIKSFMFQLLKSLNYIHAMGVCHRDLKPHNVLVDPETSVLKLCDFGSAKVLVPGEPNVSYISSRYYRAPELIFGACEYTTAIDVWSAGCVLAEMFTGAPFFRGETTLDQLVEIIKRLGTPSAEELHDMNPDYVPDSRFPSVRPRLWSDLLPARTPPEGRDLTDLLLRYSPESRVTAGDALAHPFFDDLRKPSTLLPNGNPLPEGLFRFGEKELSIVSEATRESMLSAASAFDEEHLSQGMRRLSTGSGADSSS